MIRALQFLSPLVLATILVTSSVAHANLVQNGNFATGDLSDWALSGANSMSVGAGGQVIQQPTTNLAELPAAFVQFDSSLGQNVWLTGGGGAGTFATLSQQVPTIAGHRYDISYVFSFSAENGSENPGVLLTLFGSAGSLAENTWLFHGGSPFTPLPPNALQLIGSGKLCADPFDCNMLSVNGNFWYFKGTYIENSIAIATGDLTSLEFADTSPDGFFDITDIVVTDVAAVPEPSSILLFSSSVLGLCALLLVGARRSSISL